MVLKTFNSGPQLRYPITVVKLFKGKGIELSKTDRLVQYMFKYTRTVGDPDLDEEREIEETGYGYWDCPTDGILSQWRVKEGDVVTRDQPFVVIDEPCDHDQQYGGLCVKCGKDMKESNWATVERDTDRAPISMVHDNVALTVSSAEATQKELDLQKRMLKNRKLSLVVDLDQTIIHACIEPTIGEWQSDPNNPNYEAVKDVRKFQLDDGPRNPQPGAPRRRCWYYIKMRPGLAGFLERISELFELHVYTMGTRTYAQEIAKIVDPDMKLFGNRIISRDENGSMTAKSLQRLFPVSTNMVVVIDDRADVWPRNRSNVIKVTPYDFFKGIGDINSSFLPKRQDIMPAAAVPVPILPVEVPESAGAPGQADDAAKPEKVILSTSDETKLLLLQAEEQERALEKQLTERPLLHMQEELDKAEAEVEGASPEDIPGSPEIPHQNGHPESPPRHRHNLLRDDDEELVYVEQHLTELHRSFYNQYDARLEARQIFKDVDAITADTVPDAGKVLELLKKRALRGCSIVLSGLLPTNQDVHRSEIGQQLMNFGADLRTRVSDKVTHLVVSSLRPRTQKMQQAARIPSIKIVNQDWVAGSLAQWRKLDEGPFLIEVHPSDRLGASPAGATPPRLTISTARPGQQVSEDSHKQNGDDDDMADNTDAEDNPVDDEDEDDEVVDTYGVMPSALGDGERSPVDELKKMDWGKLDDMLAEEFGSDIDSESDSEMDDSEAEPSETPSQSQEMDVDSESKTKSRKRKLDEEAGDGESAGEGGSALSKKQKLAKARTTGLRNVKNVGEEDGEGSGLPTPMGTGDEEEGAPVVEEEPEDDGFDDLEAELEAELAADAAAQGMG